MLNGELVSLLDPETGDVIASGVFHDTKPLATVVDSHHPHRTKVFYFKENSAKTGYISVTSQGKRMYPHLRIIDYSEEHKSLIPLIK